MNNLNNFNNQINEINSTIESLTIDYIMLEKRINLLNKRQMKLMMLCSNILEHLYVLKEDKYIKIDMEKITKMMLE